MIAANKIAKERKSSVLASNAIHHRIDSLTSIVALTAILGSNVLNNVSWLDPVGGLLVSIMVVRAGWGNTGKALLELADVGIDDETKTTAENATLKALMNESFADGKIRGADMEVREIQGIKAGQSYLIDIELAVPEKLTVGESRVIEDLVRQKVGASNRGIRRVRVRFVARSDKSVELSDEFVSQDRDSVAENETAHDHAHDHGHGHGHQHDSQHTSDLNSKKQL